MVPNGYIPGPENVKRSVGVGGNGRYEGGVGWCVSVTLHVSVLSRL